LTACIERESETMSNKEIDRAHALWGKRVRVWYGSERKWKTAKVRCFYIYAPPRGKARVYFQLTCGGKINPWYYAADEIHPLKREARPGKRARSAAMHARRGLSRPSAVRYPGRGR
jgi:hypothetical protein